MSTHLEVPSDELAVRILDGPPDGGFDCGRAEQTDFLYERAWDDQQAWLSVTYLFYFRGILAAYSTVCTDSIPSPAANAIPSPDTARWARSSWPSLVCTVASRGLGSGAR